MPSGAKDGGRGGGGGRACWGEWGRPSAASAPLLSHRLDRGGGELSLRRSPPRGGEPWPRRLLSRGGDLPRPRPSVRGGERFLRRPSSRSPGDLSRCRDWKSGREGESRRPTEALGRESRLARGGESRRPTEDLGGEFRLARGGESRRPTKDLGGESRRRPSEERVGEGRSLCHLLAPEGRGGDSCLRVGERC